jgi:type II secretory pathway pseudopilin PulG
MPTYRPVRAEGFSLLELIVVLTILVTMTMMVMPVFKGSLSDAKVEHSMRDMHAMIKSARSLAMSEGNEYRIYFNSKKNQYIHNILSEWRLFALAYRDHGEREGEPKQEIQDRNRGYCHRLQRAGSTMKTWDHNRFSPTRAEATPRRHSSESGYILLEAMVALALLGVISYSIHGTFQQALLTRAQAQDYTRARFLLEQLVADRQLQPIVTQGAGDGFFTGETDERFQWAYQIQKVNLPKPPKPINPPKEGTTRPKFRYPKDSAYLVHVVATVSWRRGGQDFSESIETLFSPRKLWQSAEDEEADLWDM